MKSKLFSFKSLCCMAIALSVLVLFGGVFSSALADWGAVGTGTDGYVMSLAADSSGNVYAGGGFATAGGVNVDMIAKWNGSSWSALESGMYWCSEVQALVFDSSGNMYAGGFFFSTGAVAGLNSIAKWNGSTWSALDSGVFLNGAGGGIVKKLAVDKSGNLYAGGVFDHAGGVFSANNIAKWNGSAWSALGSGMSGALYALAVDSSGNLYAGGSQGVLKWNGSAWSALGSGTNGIVYALAVDSTGNVYAGGEFTTAGGVAVNNIAKWNGSTWSALGSGMNGYVGSLAFDSSGNVYAGGTFTTAGGVSANNIAKWNGSAWSTVGSGMNGTDSGVFSLAFDSSGNLYAGGQFSSAGGLPANNIAKYSSSNIISGYVRDSGNTGISGVTMTFSDGSTVATDSSGYYSRTVSPGWSGTVTPSKSGFMFTPSNRTYSNVKANQLNQDYTGVPITRIINISPSSLAFGDVNIGSTSTKTMTISNTGNSALTVSSITYPAGFSGNWSGTIAPGSSSQPPVTVTFTPTAVQSYGGTVTVNSDKTSGTNTIAISGNGINNIPTTPFVTRTLPTCYTAGTKFTVTLTATPPGGTTNYMIEDLPPDGWTVSNISSPGTYDTANKKVKFVFYDGISRTLTYDLLPPANATGDKTFGGQASKNSVSTDIAGQTSIKAQQYHPADLNNDLKLPMSEVSAYITAWMNGSTWSVAPNPIPSDYVLRAAIIWQKGGESYRINCTLSPPMCWEWTPATSSRSLRSSSTAVRQIPAFYQAGQAVTVSIIVKPGSDVAGYIAEDIPPAGWTVADGSVSDGGRFDTVYKTVKYPPFTDNTTRTLTYKAVPPTNAGGAYVFDGKVTFDTGVSEVIQITGNSAVTDAKPDPGDVNGDRKVDLADAIVALQVVAGVNPPNVFASADVNSDNKIGLEEVIYVLQKVAGLR